MSTNSISATFYPLKEAKSKTCDPIKRETAEKICRLLQKSGFTAEIEGSGPHVHVIASDRFTPPLHSSSFSADAVDKKVRAVKAAAITDNQAFEIAFSWPMTRQASHAHDIAFSLIPREEEISYAADGSPHVDKGWDPFIESAITQATKNIFRKLIPAYQTEEGELYVPKYREGAERLLQRFLANNPQFIETPYRQIHRALMIQAAATAIKVEEDNAVWNNDIAAVLNPELASYLTKDLQQMELLFFRGLEWNANTEPES